MFSINIDVSNLCVQILITKCYKVLLLFIVTCVYLCNIVVFWFELIDE